MKENSKQNIQTKEVSHEPLYPHPTVGYIVPLLLFYKYGFGIK